MRRVVVAVAAVLVVGAALVGVQAGARADQSGNPLTTTATVAATGATNVAPNNTLSGLHSGDLINVDVTAPVGTTLFKVEARLCQNMDGFDITLPADFSVSSGNCVSAPLKPSTDAYVTAFSTASPPAAAPNREAHLEFTVGTGTDTTNPITCDATSPCDLWVRESFSPVPVGTDDPAGMYVHYDLSFAGAAATPPGEPTAVSATAGNGGALVSWTAPADAGSSPISGYTVTSSPGAKTCTTAGTTSCTVSGLTNFTPYTFTVTASNGQSGPASTASAAVTPTPDPAVITGTTPGNGQVAVSWSAASPAPTGYTVTSSPGAQTCTTASTSCTVTGLSNGTGYTFVVTADYGSGHTIDSRASASVTPNPPVPHKPSSPTGLGAVAGNGTAVVSWSAPSDDGNSTIDGYTVTSSPDGKTCTTNGLLLGCTVSGLTDFTAYTFTVTAHNADGFTSDPSSPSPSVTPKPAPPEIASVTPGNGKVTVLWTNPGGTPDGYLVTSTPGGLTCSTTTATTCDVTGLTNGTSYTFKARANYAAGSVDSAVSGAAVPAGPPAAPTGVTATTAPGSTSATVSWTAPGTGGSPITGYTATASPGGASCTAATTSCSIAGLTMFTPYTFTVMATNAEGDGPTSAASSVVTPTPAAPTVSATTAGDGQVGVSWNAATPSPTSYTVTSTPGAKTCTASPGTMCTVSGLTNGTAYTFVVTASYPGGTVSSSASSPVTPVTPTPPGAPENVTVTPGNGKLDVSWSPPSSPGSSPITGYEVVATPVSTVQSHLATVLTALGCTSTTTSCTVTGVSNFTSYDVTVTASNAVGSGAAGAPAAPGVPVPTAPSITKVTPGDGSAVVEWTPADPEPTGGYVVTASPGGQTCTTATTSCTVTGLTNGTAYTFTVSATYEGGTVGSAASAAVSAGATTVGTVKSPDPTGGDPSAASSVTPKGNLPYTGSNVAGLLAIAVAFVLGGTGLARMARRRELEGRC